jgi:hypothetical protein
MESTSPERVYRLMETNKEARAAISDVVTGAQRELRIFDISASAMREREIGTSQFVDRVRSLLHASRGHRLRIVLHEIAAFESELPRLVNLMGQYSGQVAVHRTIGVARSAMDPLVIGDDIHFWHKLHADHPRSVLTLHDAHAVMPLLERFEDIWQSSELAVTAGTLGL